MSKNARKMTAAAGMVFLICSICGCGARSTLSVQTVAYTVVVSEPYSYDVYVFSQDNVVYYDFSKYAMENGFDFFSEPLPEEGTYIKEEFTLAESDWDSIVNVINEEHFSELPEELRDDGIRDGTTFYIEVKSGGSRYFSGGYGAGCGVSGADRAFARVQDVLEAAAGAVGKDR